jgi:hypothetical protein
MTIVMNVLVIFALLLMLGYAPAIALSRARAGTLTDKDLQSLDAAGLPLSDHALQNHSNQKYNTQVIQEMLRMGICSPKVYYPNCANSRVILGCKASAGGHTWAMLVISFKNFFRPVIVTGYALPQKDLDKTAARHGCSLPGLYMP